ncbi:uncharacterized protein RHO25_010226 [Cercospora beticola]|nr:hypothetical protein RHO25_010226 [Cercospora beticola]
MCDIYQRGDHNLIWLTPPDKYKYTPTEARSILNSLQAVKTNIKRATGGKFRSLMNNPAGTETQNGRLLDASIDLKSLQLLFQSEWFRRLWVAQEAALSQQSTCHFGPCKFPLSDILDAAAWLLYNGLMLPPPMRKQRGLWAARSMWYILDRRNNPDTDLFMAYVLTQNFEATEARDHVYALMGLFKDQQPHLRLRGLLLRPKYTKPLPEVFRDATRACVEDSRNLQALQFVEPSKVPAGYPSWTLLFDAGLSGRDADPICKLGNGFRADGNATCYVMFDEPDTLKARGADIDGIEEYSPTFSSAKSWTNGDHAKLMGQVGSMIRKRRPGKDWINELGLVLVAGHNTSRDRTVVDDFAAFLRYSKQYPTQRLAVPEGQQHDEKNRAGRWYSRFEQTMYGRKFFMTRGGLAGIGPPNMKSGDRIVVLCGGSVPFVMRSTGRKREYVLIGVCYVFGLMQGEFKDYFVAEWMSVR